MSSGRLYLFCISFRANLIFYVPSRLRRKIRLPRLQWLLLWSLSPSVSPPFFSFFEPEAPVYGWSFMEDLYIADTEIIFYVPDTLFFSLPYKTKARESSETSTVKADQAANANVLQMHLFHSHRLSHPAPSVYVLIRSGSPALPRVNAQQTPARYQHQTENISGSAEKARRSAASAVWTSSSYRKFSVLYSQARLLSHKLQHAFVLL